MSHAHPIKVPIDALKNAIPELKGIVLATREGLPIAHTLSVEIDPNRIASLAAASFVTDTSR